MSINQYLDVAGARYLVRKVKSIINESSLSFENLKNKPNTLEGYGIIDALKAEDLDNYVTKSELKDLEEMLNPKLINDSEDLAAILDMENSTAIISENVSLSESFVIPSEKEVVLNLQNANITTTANNNIVVNGKLTINGNGTIQGSGRPFYVNEGGELILNGPTVISNNDCGVNVKDGGIVTLNDGTIQAQEFGIIAFYENSTININGGVVKALDNACIGGNGSSGAGGTIINMTGGRLESHIQSNGYVACGIYLPNNGICNISGGEIVAINGCGICQRAGVLNITGGFISGSGDPELKGKVGDSRVVVGPNGIVVDQSAHYPGITADAANNGLHLNIYSGTIIGKNTAIQVLADEGYETDINIQGGLLMPAN